MLAAHGEDVPNLDELELNGELIFFPFGGSNLAVWASRLKALNRPEFHICDRDNPPPEPARYQAYMDEVNARPNCSAVATTKREMENYLHPQAIRQAYQNNGIEIQIADNFADFDDVPRLVAQAVHESTAEEAWDTLSQEGQREKEKRAKRLLNHNALKCMSVELLAECDQDGELRGWLNNISQIIDAD